MTSTAPLTQPQRSRLRSATRSTLMMLGAMLALTACGGLAEPDAIAEVAAPPSATATEPVIVFEEPRSPGTNPFTETTVTRTADVVAAMDADERVEIGPGLYGGTDDQQVCDQDLLVASLEAQPEKAAAWADAVGIDVDDIDEFVGELTPALLAHDTRVTNHGFRDGHATPFQSTLGAGTAVLVDDDGTPATRCACGNPLVEPTQPSAPAPDGVETPSDPLADQLGDDGIDETVDNDEADTPPAVTSFCDVWAHVAPTMVGGPSGPGAEALAAYLAALSDGLDELIASAEATPGFPADGLADLIAYDEMIEAAIAAGGVPGPGDIALRDRVELFLGTYCDDDSPESPAPDGTDDDTADDDDPPSANCGSMQFLLLIAAADGLGLDHTAVSAPVLAAMQDVAAGADPGEEFDVGDLAPMIAYEEIGCQGAQAMQQLFEDSGWGDVIDGTELGA